jgi:predicted small secreted protein
MVAKALLTLALLTSVGAALSACHTVEGAGQDITDTGRTVQRAF